MIARPPARWSVAAALAVALAAGCSNSPGTTDSDPSSLESSPTMTSSAAPATAAATGASADADQEYPDVVAVELSPTGDTWTVDATISSPYDSPDRYADAFRVLAPDGTELGVRELLHDHASEQPFTRSLTGATIPHDVTEVTVEGRDLVNGWGGETVTVPMPR